MKKFLLPLALLVTTNVFAQSIVDEQITQTKKVIDELVKSVSQPTDVKELNTPDFRIWDTAYRAKVVQEIRNYEAKVIGLINTNLRQPLENYNRVIKSKEFTEAQKEQLLQTTETQLNQAIANSNSQYAKFAQALLDKVHITRLVYDAKVFRRVKRNSGYYSCYSSDIKLKVTPKMINENGEVTKTVGKASKVFAQAASGCPKRKYVRESAQAVVGGKKGVIAASAFGGISVGDNDGFLNGYFPEFAKGCERQVCISLKQGTVKETLQKVLTVNRSLNFTTLNRKNFTLTATSPTVELNALSQTNYPQAYFALPFDF
jgi:hypothetical protein